MWSGNLLCNKLSCLKDEIKNLIFFLNFRVFWRPKRFHFLPLSVTENSGSVLPLILIQQKTPKIKKNSLISVYQMDYFAVNNINLLKLSRQKWRISLSLSQTYTWESSSINEDWFPFPKNSLLSHHKNRTWTSR